MWVCLATRPSLQLPKKLLYVGFMLYTQIRMLVFILYCLAGKVASYGEKDIASCKIIHARLAVLSQAHHYAALDWSV
jgi:hypothetical protein